MNKKLANDYTYMSFFAFKTISSGVDSWNFILSVFNPPWEKKQLTFCAQILVQVNSAWLASTSNERVSVRDFSRD